jgi:hypothetical protein
MSTTAQTKTPTRKRPSVKTLTERCLLVKFEKSMWGATRKSSAAMKVVTEHFGTDDRVHRDTIFLIDPKAKEFVEVRRAINAAYNVWYHATLPWSDDGFRILPMRNPKATVTVEIDGASVEKPYFQHFIDRMDEKIREAEDAVEAFIAAYPRLIREGKKALNGLSKGVTYPSDAEIRDKFGARVKTRPVPSGEDFRTQGLDRKTLDRMSRDLEDSIRADFESATRDLARRLVKSLAKLAERLAAYESNSDSKTAFHASLVTNVTNMAETVKEMNFTEDAKLDRLADHISTTFADVNVEKIKTDEKERKAQRAKVDAALKKCDAYLN